MPDEKDDVPAPGDLPGWSKESLPLPATHQWVCKPGNKLFVADRGAVSFEFPDTWIVDHGGKNLTIHDKPHPHDSARLTMTIWHLPPVKGGWSGLPLGDMLRDSIDGDEAKRGKGKAKGKAKPKRPARKRELHTELRPDLELVWTDTGCWSDPESGKPIRCRQLVARARLVAVLITFDVYDDMKEQFAGVWTDLLQSLKVAVPRDLAGNVVN